MNDYQFRDTVQFFNKQFDDLKKPQEKWTAHTLKNLPKIKKENGLWKQERLYGTDNEKAMVIVGASPILERDIEKLKECDDSFIIISVNSALKMLLKHGITPHYVIMIDAHDEHMAQHLDVDSDGLTLITTNASSPDAIDKWKGKILWMPYFAVDENLRRKVRKLLGRTIPSGGNAASMAISAAYNVWHARIFIIVGNEYCYDDHYYVDKESKWDSEDVSHFRVKDSKGRDRFTNLPLYQYKMWLDHFIAECPDGVFVDTSDGILGTDAPQCLHMDLSEAIVKVKESFKMKELAKTDWHLREQLRYNRAYQVERYFPENGLKIWKDLFKKNSMERYKTILDVGCGPGQGVAMCRNRGIEAYGIDFASELMPFWRQANIVPFCRVASADSIPFEDGRFDLVTCMDMLEHVPEEGVPGVLKEIARVGKREYLFIICLTPAVNKMYDGSEPHICLKSLDWWKDQVEKAGMEPIKVDLTKAQSHVTIGALKCQK